MVLCADMLVELWECECECDLLIDTTLVLPG